MASYDDLDSLLHELTEAAIKADMWERSFTWQEGDRFEDPMGQSVVHRGNPGANDLAPSDEGIDFEALVFNHWPGVIEDIFAAWRPEVIPDPAAFQSVIDALSAASAPLDFPSLIEPPAVLAAAGPPVGASGDMAGLVDRLERQVGRLQGRWIEAFHREYLTPLPYVLGNQAAMLEVLAAGVTAEQEIWRRAREDVAELAASGREWFDAIRDSGNVVELVIGVGASIGYAFTVVYTARKGAVQETIESAMELWDSGAEVKALIDQNEPDDPRETGYPDTIQGIVTKIAQSLEYTLNEYIVFTEENLRDLVQGSARSITAGRGTFAMGDQHLAQVAQASSILTADQALSEEAVAATVSGLLQLSDQVTAAASGIWTSVYPFVRPGSIGIGDRGPYDAVLELENAVADAMHDTAFNLERVATSVRIAADFAFAADAESASALGKANDRLAQAQQRYSESLRPTGRGMSPYTPPSEELHVEVPDCGPPVDDLLGFGETAQTGPPFAAPS